MLSEIHLSPHHTFSNLSYYAAFTMNQTSDYIKDSFKNYVTENHEVPTLYELSSVIGIPRAEIYDQFSNSSAVVNAIYCDYLDDYKEAVHSMDEFKGLDAGEKFTHLTLTLVDQFGADAAFTKLTFSKAEGILLFDSNFERSLKSILKGFITHDERISAFIGPLIQPAFYDFLTWQIKDAVKSVVIRESHTMDAITELTDKFAQLLNGVLYTSVPDQAANFFKTLYQQGHFSLKKFL